MGSTWNKIQWTPEMLSFLKQNFFTKTNPELAKELGLKLTSVRTKCYELGLSRMEMEYFTDEQICYLTKNYKRIGDVELAEYFQKHYPKKKSWSKKHIEKKRRYLGLKRSESELENIKERNRKAGRFAICNKKRWLATGQFPIGQLRIWRNQFGKPVIVIKTNIGYRHYARWIWAEKHGKIKRGFVVRIIDKTKPITIENLELISWAENAVKNAAIRMNYPDEIRQAQRMLSKINKLIKQKENEKQ